MTLLGSRPLRALAVILLAYGGVRAWWVSPTAGPPPTAVAEGTRVRASDARPTVLAASDVPRSIDTGHQGTTAYPPPAAATAAGASHRPRRQNIVASATIAARTDRFAPTLTAETLRPPEQRVVRPEPAPRQALSPEAPFARPTSLPDTSWRRLSGSAWLLLREDGGSSLVPGGLLGGNQSGARLLYQPGRRTPFLTVRASAPLSSVPGKEIAIGAGVRGRNVGVIVEQRIALDRGQPDDLAVIAYGGVSERPLPFAFRFDGYAQAGIVGLKRQTVFVDGSARVERTVASGPRWRLSAGAGLWGATQTGLSRLDAGPQIVARTGDGMTALRVSGEWRLRIAGNARPSSGPALTVGADF